MVCFIVLFYLMALITRYIKGPIHLNLVSTVCLAEGDFPVNHGKIRNRQWQENKNKVIRNFKYVIQQSLFLEAVSVMEVRTRAEADVTFFELMLL